MQPLTQKQVVFRDMILGILAYAVVLGFFVDYTDIVQTTSYSTTFAVAVVMQVLTYVTLILKDKILAVIKNKYRIMHKGILAFVIWFIVFVSKFIYLAVIDVLFGESVEISGFVGLMAVIITVTLLSYVLLYIQNKLGKTTLN